VTVLDAVEPGVRLTLVGEKVKDIPVAVGDTDADIETTPVKPWLLVVMVEVADWPAMKLAGVASPAVTEKSPVTVTVTVAVWDSVPLAPVTVTVYVPAGADTDVAIVSVLVPEEPVVRLMLVGKNVNVIPGAVGETVVDNPTLPVNPRLFDVMVEVVDPPAMMLAGVAGPADIVKSPTTVSVTVVA
jgi:hypothetical protein